MRPFWAVGAKGLDTILATTTVPWEVLVGSTRSEVTRVSWSDLVEPYSWSTVTCWLAAAAPATAVECFSWALAVGAYRVEVGAPEPNAPEPSVEGAAAWAVIVSCLTEETR